MRMHPCMAFALQWLIFLLQVSTAAMKYYHIVMTLHTAAAAGYV